MFDWMNGLADTLPWPLSAIFAWMTDFTVSGQLVILVDSFVRLFDFFLGLMGVDPYFGALVDWFTNVGVINTFQAVLYLVDFFIPVGVLDVLAGTFFKAWSTAFTCRGVVEILKWIRGRG